MRHRRPDLVGQLGSTDSVLPTPGCAISGLASALDDGPDSSGAACTCRLHREVRSATRRNRSPSSSRRDRVISTKNTPTTMITATATATMIGVTSGSFRPAGTYPYLTARLPRVQLGHRLEATPKIVNWARSGPRYLATWHIPRQ